MFLFILFCGLFLYSPVNCFGEGPYFESCEFVECLHGGECKENVLGAYCSCHEFFLGIMCESLKPEILKRYANRLEDLKTIIQDTTKITNSPKHTGLVTNVDPMPIPVDRLPVSPVLQKIPVIAVPENVPGGVHEKEGSNDVSLIIPTINEGDVITPTMPVKIDFITPVTDPANSSQVAGGGDGYTTKSTQVIADEQRMRTNVLIFFGILVLLTMCLVLYGVLRLGQKQKYVKVTNTFIPPLLGKNSENRDGFTSGVRPRLYALGSSGDDTMTTISSPMSVAPIFTKLHELASTRGTMDQLTDELKMCLTVADESGKMAIHWAADAETDKTEDDIISDIDLLVGAGQSVAVQDNVGYTPLIYAIVRGRKNVAIRLLDISNVHLFDNEGRNALYYAINACMVEVVEHMVRFYRADINYVYSDNEALLHKAVRLGRPGLSVVKFLVNCHSCDVNNVGDRQTLGFTGVTPLHVAAQCSNIEAIKMIYMRTKSISCMDRYNRSPLFYAVESNRPEAVRALLDVGAQTQINVNCDFGLSPLMVAEKQGYTNILLMLKSVLNPMFPSPLRTPVFTRFPFYPVPVMRPVYDTKRKMQFTWQPQVPVYKKRCFDPQNNV